MRSRRPGLDPLDVQRVDREPVLVLLPRPRDDSEAELIHAALPCPDLLFSTRGRAGSAAGGPPGRGTIVGGVDELTDSAALAGDQGALRGRLAEDGYLFFRGLLPAADVRAAAAGVLAGLRRGGWVDDRGIPSADRRALSVLEALGDPAFRAAIASPAFNRIPYLAPLRGLARLILGPGGFSYPAKVLRAVYPERPPGLARGRYIHQDYAVSGVQDMLTSWVPMMEIPVRLGGLAVLTASQLGPPQRPRVLRQDERGWATADYRAGDVLVFHCLTSHAALPNLGTSLRLSGDFLLAAPRPDGARPARARSRGRAARALQPDVRRRSRGGSRFPAD